MTWALSLLAFAAVPAVDLEVHVSDDLQWLEVRATEVFVPSRDAEALVLALPAERVADPP